MDFAKLTQVRMLRISLLLVLGALLPATGLAETVYVNDSLRVGVRTEPGNSVAPHGVVITGMRLEVLARSDGYVKIRNEAGVEGWIKDIYITTEKPAKLELATLTEEHAKLQAQLAKQDKLIKTSTTSTTSLSEELQALKTANTELQAKLAQTSVGEYTKATQRYGGWLILLLVGTGVGFAVGVSWHRRQAMRRLGGLRV